MNAPVEAIQNFDEEKMVMNIQNNYDGANSGRGNIGNNQTNSTFNFNPLDKLMELVDENRKLYERLLQSEKEKTEMLQRILEEKD